MNEATNGSTLADVERADAWGAFLQARARAIRALAAVGRSDLDIVHTLNLDGSEHVRRIRESTAGRQS